jgi:hypothetical protein
VTPAGRDVPVLPGARKSARSALCRAEPCRAHPRVPGATVILTMATALPRSLIVAAAVPALALAAWALLDRRRSRHHRHSDAHLVETMLKAIEQGMFARKPVLEEFLDCCFELAADEPTAPCLQRAVAVCSSLGAEELRAAASGGQDDLDGVTLAAMLHPLARLQELAAAIGSAQPVQVCRVKRSAISVAAVPLAHAPAPSEHEEHGGMEAKLERVEELVEALPLDPPALHQARAELLSLVAEMQAEEARSQKVVLGKAISAFKSAGFRQKSQRGQEFLGAMGLQRWNSKKSSFFIR